MTSNYKIKSLEEEHKKFNLKYNLTISKNEIGEFTKRSNDNKLIEDLEKRLFIIS